MKNLLKLKVIITIFTIIYATQAAAERILPKVKPIFDKETKIQSININIIYPEKKTVSN